MAEACEALGPVRVAAVVDVAAVVFVMNSGGRFHPSASARRNRRHLALVLRGAAASRAWTSTS